MGEARVDGANAPLTGPFFLSPIFAGTPARKRAEGSLRMADDTGTGTAVAADSSSASPVAQTASPDSASVPATAAPVTTDAQATQGISGEPPKERWDSILANTRDKTRAEVEAEFKQKYGWADQLETNPVEFYEWLDSQLAAHPEHGPRILALHAKALQSRRGRSAEPPEEPVPDVPIVDANGNQTGQTYSAAQLKKWQEWNWQQQQHALDERFGPLEKLNKRVEEAEQHAQVQQQATEHTKATLESLRADPFFTKHEAAIKAEFAAHEDYGDNIHAAYVRVLTRDVLPTLSQTGQRELLDSLNSKAAGTTVNPGGTTTTQRPSFKKKDGSPDWDAAFEWFSTHPEDALVMANR